MPTLQHNGLVDMFRNRPELTPHLVERLLHQEMPAYASVAVMESTLDQLVPTEFQADLVLELKDATGQRVLSIVLEVQRDIDPLKMFSWPVYLVVLRARTRCPVILVVIPGDARVEAWAREAIDLGLGLSSVRPLVLGPSVVPEVTDPEVAVQGPELTLLSALAHSEGPSSLAVLRAAATVLMGLEAGPATVYFQIIHNALSGPLKETLEKLVMEQRANSMSDDNDLPPFLRQFVERGELKGKAEGKLEGKAEGKLEGKAEGKLEGKREMLLHLLGRSGLVLTAEERQRVEACSDSATLDRWSDNLLGAKTAADVFA